MTTDAIRTHRLTKRFGERVAVDALDLAVPAGTVVGYLGPNGAGKTTTLKIIVGLFRATSGSATVLGMDATRDRDRVQRRLGSLPGDFAGYPGMTGQQLLRLLGSLRGGVNTGRVAELADRFQLDLGRRIGTLSHGNRQKIGIIQAFMHRPELLVLDEPTAGLDPIMQREFLSLVREPAGEGATVLLSSHVLSEVAAVADRVAVIDEGRLRVARPVHELTSSTQRRIELTFDAPVPTQDLIAAPGVVAVGTTGRTALVTVAGSTAGLLRVAAPYGVSDVTSHEPDLADVFLGLYDESEASAHGHRVPQGIVGAAS